MKVGARMVFVLAVLGFVPGVASAQEIARPLQIVSPNAPGGPNDFIARLISVRLGELLRQNVIVENRASANGVVGAEYVARAAPDGSIIGIGNSGTHAINATLYRQLTYDPVRDFSPITELAETGLVLVAHPGVPANSVAELIALAKKSPDKLNIAVAGATGEVAGNALKIQARIGMANIPYKGGAPAVIAVISGEADMTITTYGAVIGQIKAGKLKPLAVTSAKRLALLPDVRTVAENGLPGYEAIIWYGFLAPARTPEKIVHRLRDEMVKVLNMPVIRERLLAENFDIIGSTPEEFAAMVKREVEKYRKIILESGMSRL
jgi:tripartite-type tricarboxylate transporter receptor subunit TctC